MKKIKFLGVVRSEHASHKVYIPARIARALEIERGDLIELGIEKISEKKEGGD